MVISLWEIIKSGVKANAYFTVIIKLQSWLEINLFSKLNCFNNDT